MTPDIYTLSFESFDFVSGLVLVLKPSSFKSSSFLLTKFHAAMVLTDSTGIKPDLYPTLKCLIETGMGPTKGPYSIDDPGLTLNTQFLRFVLPSQEPNINLNIIMSKGDFQINIGTVGTFPVAGYDGADLIGYLEYRLL